MGLSRQSRDALSAQGDSKASLEALKRQGFDNVFFRLLNLQSDSLNKIMYVQEGMPPVWGVEALVSICAIFPKQEDFQALFIPGGSGNAARMEGIKNEYVMQTNPALRHYFETIEQIILYVDEASGDLVADKERYFSILSAMLSLQEIKVLQHYISSDSGAGLRERIFGNAILKEKIMH